MLFRDFRTAIHDAISVRRTATLPPVKPLVLLIGGATVACIVGAVLLVPTGTWRAFHFIDERGAITAMSAIFLAGAGAFSLATWVTMQRAGEAECRCWVVLACGFVFLALDELLGFHEGVGRALAGSYDPGVFRNWNDVVVVLYGVAAVPAVAWFLPTLLRSRMVLEMFAAAFLLYGLHTIIDSVTSPPTTASIILEESAKLASGAFLLLGALVGFLGALWRGVPATETP